jgi:hypothetical protein
MSNTTGRGSYTDFFTSIPAGDIAVVGLPSGSAGSRGPVSTALSSNPGLFTVSADLAAIVAATGKFIPARPGTQTSETGLEDFALAA